LVEVVAGWLESEVVTKLTTTGSISSAVRSLGQVLVDVDGAVVRGFARAVGDQLDIGPLTLATRDRLLGRAQRLGIKRFDANLIVAAVEQNARTVARMRITRLDEHAATKRSRWFAPATVALGMQTLIALGAWWLLA